MRVLALDIGSSSVKAALVAGGRVGPPVRVPFETRYQGERAEVEPRRVLAAIHAALGELELRGRVDLLALCNMAPSWVAMDARGRPLTPLITHQDRRSVEEAQQLEAAVPRYLQISGNRPFPGGISSTTAAWFARHEPAVLKKAHLTGHLNTLLLRRWTGARITDPSNASFMGLYQTTTLGGWDPTLCEAAGVAREQLPQVVEANQVAGRLSRSAAAELRLVQGLPVLPGIIDTSAAMLAASPPGGRGRTLLNVSGSTDVLALSVTEPRPHPQLLTRALGVGRRWMAVSTLASAGTTLQWLKATLFADLSEAAFYRLVKKLLSRGSAGGVRFEPYLGGDRVAIEQKQGSFASLTLATKRGDMLSAAIDALARQSAARLPLFEEVYGRLPRRVSVAGGTGLALSEVLHKNWPGRWIFRPEREAMLRGLFMLGEQAVQESRK